jgi:hypothetical protein
MVSRKLHISFKIELSKFNPLKIHKILNAISSYAPVKEFSTNVMWSSSFIKELVEGQELIKGIAITYLYNDDTMDDLFQRITNVAVKANGNLLKLRFEGTYINKGHTYWVADETPWVTLAAPFRLF